MSFVYGVKISKKIYGSLDDILINEFKNTDIVFELINNYYYIYLKDTKNIKILENHKLIYFKNTLKRVKSEFLYNIYPDKIDYININ